MLRNIVKIVIKLLEETSKVFETYFVDDYSSDDYKYMGRSYQEKY